LLLGEASLPQAADFVGRGRGSPPRGFVDTTKVGDRPIELSVLLPRANQMITVRMLDWPRRDVHALGQRLNEDCVNTLSFAAGTMPHRSAKGLGNGTNGV